MNALAKLAGPSRGFDVVGPSAEDDVRRAISRYGAKAVKEAVDKLTRPKRGRKAQKDWPELRDVIKADAAEWLAGGDPLSTRTNYSIAKEFAARNPGHNPVSTYKRIERKLVKKPHDRQWFMLVQAENMSREGVPHRQHIRALEALSQLELSAGAQAWEWSLNRANSDIADYEAKTGQPPAPELSMKEIQDVAHNALLRLGKPAEGDGKTGLLGAYLSVGHRYN